MVGYTRDLRTGLVTFWQAPLFTVEVKVDRERDVPALFEKLGRPIERSFKRKDSIFVGIALSEQVPAVE
ncbi:MAG: hypothetical protein H6R02_2429 [Burkholderiaceae bacterium]|nr:hypothetical protein [Burkholderiaceae bacterium]